MARKQGTIISLFSGAMGLDLGLENAGFETRATVEKNTSAVATILANRKTMPVLRDITKITTAELLEKAGLEAGDVTLVSGGPCCQSFSTAGNRKSLSDDRGGLFKDFIRIVDEAQPRFFVMENVKGILSAAVRHRPLNERGPGHPPLATDEELGSALRIILQELSALNYYIKYGLVNCADYGVPQNRLRVIFLGSRDGEDLQWLIPSHAKKKQEGLKGWKTLKSAIGKLREKNPEHVRFPADREDLLNLLTEGQNWTDLPERLQRKALGAALDSWGGRSGFCRRLKWKEPSPTLTTSPAGRATTLCHPDKLRPLTVKEYAKIQQFPRSWKFVGSIQQKYMLIGNAVPVGLGEGIGKALLTTMQKTARRKPTAAEIKERLGSVSCVDPALEARILKRKRKTQLNPPHMLNTQDREAINEWLASSAAA